MPWWQVGLTVLPGLFVLPRVLFSTSTLSTTQTAWQVLFLAIMILLIVSSVVWAVMRRSPFQVPVWGFIPLGVLVGVLTTVIAMYSGLGFSLTCSLLFATGLLFARHNGLNACLFVLPAGVLMAIFTIEPGMFLRDSSVKQFLAGDGMIVLFTVVMPILVLRARSIFGQAVGLLLPLGAYAAAFVFALNDASGLVHPWFQFSFSQTVSVASPVLQLLVTIAAAAVVYGWISISTSTAAPGGRPGTPPPHMT